MTDNKQQVQQRQSFSWFHIVLLVLAAAAIAWLAARNLDSFVNILTVILGFGAVILIHEFGHFIVAKSSGIKVEAFSIGFPPTLIGIRKLKRGWRVRILPKLTEKAPAEGQAEPEGADTEYRIGLLPFGGFVKMLGQEDTGSVEHSEDPRSFANKPIWVRIAVVAAGVVFNAISAIFIFMGVFLVGLNLPPAVVGMVQPDSPAAEAGIQPGDRILAINGETFVDFSSLVLAPALAGRGEPIELLVEHPNGEQETIEVTAAMSARSAMPVRTIGIEQASTLTIDPAIAENPAAAKMLEENTGFVPGDTIVAVNGEPVAMYHEFQQAVENALMPEAVITVRRSAGAGEEPKLVDITIPTAWNYTTDSFATEFDMGHVQTMAPLLKINFVEPPSDRSIPGKIRAFFEKEDSTEQAADPTRLQPGDILVKAGTIEYPTYRQLREETEEHANVEMPLTVLRKDAQGGYERTTVLVHPKAVPNSDRVTIGIALELAPEMPVVAGTLETEAAPTPPEIPAGATLTAVGGEPVENFYDVVRVLRESLGEEVTVAYRATDGQTGTATVQVPLNKPYITVEAGLEYGAPLAPMKQLFQADNPVEAVAMGAKKTWQFILQTIVTLQRLISGEMSPRNLMGPVGIISASYTIAQKDLIDYIYFLGLISSIIAVMNLLPLPVVDGGVIVLLLIEKIKGSPLSERVQEAISFAGVMFLLAVFVWLTYQDLVRLWFG